LSVLQFASSVFSILFYFCTIFSFLSLEKETKL
jgi:hypothetical protein